VDAARPELSVVVLSWNTKDLTLACLRALAADGTRRTREVVVVDNGSNDGSADAIAAAHPAVRLVRNAENRGYSGGNNQGAREATGRWLCLLNSDTEVRPGALDALVDWLEAHREYGMAAPRLVNQDGSVQRACMRFPGLATAFVFDMSWARRWPLKLVDDRYYMRDFDHLSSRDVEQPPGACCVIDREEYLAGGGLDEELWLFFNDVDICRRLWKRGRRIRYVAEAEVMHHVGSSTKRFARLIVTWHRNRIAYYVKHYGAWVRPYLHWIVRLRAGQERARMLRELQDPAEQRAAVGQLDDTVREILGPRAGA
jgi:N-acetylglucosaminyl-diphospho-decaprenol L-rhamnosyltransferase